MIPKSDKYRTAHSAIPLPSIIYPTLAATSRRHPNDKSCHNLLRNDTLGKSRFPRFSKFCPNLSAILGHQSDSSAARPGGTQPGGTRTVKPRAPQAARSDRAAGTNSRSRHTGAALLFLFAILVASPTAARAEEKAGEELRAYIEAQLSDLGQFSLSIDPTQVGPHGPVQPDEPGKLYRVLGWMAYGTSAADVITTEVILARGGEELNPLMRNRTVRIGSHIAYPFVFNEITEFIRKKGHPKIALWTRIAVVGILGSVSARNAHVARGLQ